MTLTIRNPIFTIKIILGWLQISLSSREYLQVDLIIIPTWMIQARIEIYVGTTLNYTAT